MTKTEIMERLQKCLKPRLYRHCVATQETAERLAAKYDVDIQKAAFAGLLHDYAKQYSDEELVVYARQYGVDVDWIRAVQPGLLHAPVSAKLVEDRFGISDPQVLHAIAVHNTGCGKMSRLDKILYVADSSEPNRHFPGVERIRELSLAGDLDGAALEAMDIKIRHVLDRRYLLHPLSVEARNDILRGIKRL